MEGRMIKIGLLVNWAGNQQMTGNAGFMFDSSSIHFSFINTTVYVSTLLTVPRSLYSFVHVSTSQSAQKSLQTYMYMYVYDPPEPVCDLTMISRPLSRWGIARCWTVVICVIWNLSSRFVIWKHIHGRETPSLVYAYNSILVVGSFY